MIPCSPGDEPDTFDEQVRKPWAQMATVKAHPKPRKKLPGKRWRPRDFWSPFRNTLADAFGTLCALWHNVRAGGHGRSLPQL